MDEVDRAFEHEEMMRRAALVAARNFRGGLSPVGECHYCGQSVSAEQLFCDAECAQEYEWLQQMRRMNGAG